MTTASLIFLVFGLVSFYSVALGSPAIFDQLDPETRVIASIVFAVNGVFMTL